MANYKGHLFGGLCAFGITFYLLSTRYAVTNAAAFEWLLFTLAGALFPDIDIKSKGQKLFYWIVCLLSFLLLWLKAYNQLIMLLLVSLTPMLVRHRGLFHRLWFVICVPIIVGMLVCLYWPWCHRILFFDILFFIAGAISHLWLDFGLRRMLRI